MHALIMNCSPVRNGATAEIVRMLAEQLSKERYWETNLEFVTKIGYKLQDLDDMMETKSKHTKFRRLLLQV